MILRSKRCYNSKFSTCYFYMKTRILAEIQICISLPLIIFRKEYTKILKRLILLKMHFRDRRREELSTTRNVLEISFLWIGK